MRERERERERERGNVCVVCMYIVNWVTLSAHTRYSIDNKR